MSLKTGQKSKILLFSGIAGIGKTTLSRVLVNFRPTGVPEPFWFNFYHNRDAKLEDVLEALEAYLETPDILNFRGKRQAGNTDINRLTEELRKRDSLWLVFDDLSYIIDEKQNFIDSDLGLLFKALRDNTHTAKIILTSRVMPLLDNGEYFIDELEDKNRKKIEGLRPDFAINYLRVNDFDNIELKTLESLVESVGGHPFSLKLLVGLAKKHTAENILKDLSVFRKHQKDRIKNARFLFDKLVGGEKELLERIAVYRQPEPLEAIKMMFTDNVPVDSVDTLLDKSLLETDHKGNYWLHPLVQEFSYEDLKNKNEAHMLAVEYYLSLPLPENPTKKEDLQPVIEAHNHACEAGEYDLAEKIIWKWNLPNLLDLWGNWRTLIEIYEKLLSNNHFKGESILKDKEFRGIALGNLGLMYCKLGDAKKSIEYSEQALKISRKIGNRLKEAAALGNIGLAYIDLEPKKSIEYSEQALKISKEISDIYGEEYWLGNLGKAYSRLGEPKNAIYYYEQALEISRDLGNRQGEGSCLGSLGVAYNALGEPKKAIYYSEQALKISREIGDRQGEECWLGNLGDEYIDQGEFKKSIEYSEQALKISREIGSRRGEGASLGKLGEAYSYLGEFKKSIEYSEQALKISREIGDRFGEGNYLGNMGNAYYLQGELKKSIEYYKQALKIDREIGNKFGEGTQLGNLGLVYTRLGKPKKAIVFLKKSLTIGKSIENPRLINFCEQILRGSQIRILT